MSEPHAGSHPAYLAHHFSDAEQQRESAKLGMWIFLLTEVLLFGGLFCFYAVYRSWYPEMFHNAHKALDLTMGATNTVVLITSSVTMALAIRCMQLGRRTQTIWFLVGTLALAATFLVIKYFEYAHKFHLGQLPGKYYHYQGIEGTNPHVFFSVYFAMTGLHGIHVIGGMTVIGYVLYKTVKGTYSSDYYTPIEMTGLYWHLVDLIWIFLFPLLYLISKGASMSKNEHAIHILPLRVYLMVGASLLALTFVTVYVSTFDFGEWNLIVAMIIAGIKATLVLFFFMHLYYDNKVYFSVFIGALLFLTIFIVFTMFDTQTRGQVNPVQESPIESKAVIYQPGGSALKGGHEEGGKEAGKTEVSAPGAVKTDTTAHGATSPKGQDSTATSVKK